VKHSELECTASACTGGSLEFVTFKASGAWVRQVQEASELQRA
jgi:hypothetical protein